MIFESLGFCIYLLGSYGQLGFSNFLGWLSFDVLRVRRKIMLTNLDIAFGKQYSLREKKQICRKATASFFLTILEFLSSRWVFPKLKIEIENGQPLHTALSRGGAFVLCTHMGNWEYMCYAGSLEFAPTSVVVKDIGTGALAEWVRRRRIANKMLVIDRKSTRATQAILKTIRDGNLCGFIVDQKRPSGEKLPFFGRLALTNTGLIQLALRRPAPIFPCLTYRVGLRKYRMMFLDELRLDNSPGVDLQTLISLNASKMNEVVEKIIRICPEQYFWMHNRWKL